MLQMKICKNPQNEGVFKWRNDSFEGRPGKKVVEIKWECPVFGNGGCLGKRDGKRKPDEQARKEGGKGGGGQRSGIKQLEDSSLTGRKESAQPKGDAKEKQHARGV